MTEPIDDIELAGGDLEATTASYANAFGWSFTSYGPDYTGIEGAGVDGGFDRTVPLPRPGRQRARRLGRVTIDVSDRRDRAVEQF